MRRLDKALGTAEAAMVESEAWLRAGFRPIALALAQRAHRLAPGDEALRAAYVKMRNTVVSPVSK